jgi:DNA-binding MarR family transcriptional regulator
LLVFSLGTVMAATTSADAIGLNVDANEVVLEVREPKQGADAKHIRQDIDSRFGNGDQTVTANEVQNYQTNHRHTFTRDEPSCFDSFNLARIDDRTPTRISEAREEVTYALGAVDERPLQAVTIVKFLYPTPSRDGPTVSIDYSNFGGDFGGSVGCYMGSSYSRQTYLARPSSCCAASARTQDGVRPQIPSPVGGSSGSAARATQPSGSDTVFLIQALAKASIDPRTIQPEAAKALWDGRALRADSDSTRATLTSTPVSFTVHGGADIPSDGLAGTARDIGAVIGYSAVGIGAVGAGLALGTEYFRYKALKWLVLVPGFTRLEKDEVLEHSKRDELYKFIKTNPGPSFSDLRRELDLSNGTLVHHLRILEAQEYVKPVRDGFRTRFYIRGPKVVPTSYLTRTQIQLIDAIAANPGLTQKELSLVLGLPRESISYHTKQLAAKGQLQIQQDGKWRRYWVPAPASPTAGAQASP